MHSRRQILSSMKTMFRRPMRALTTLVMLVSALVLIVMHADTAADSRRSWRGKLLSTGADEETTLRTFGDDASRLGGQDKLRTFGEESVRGVGRIEVADADKRERKGLSLFGERFRSENSIRRDLNKVTTNELKAIKADHPLESVTHHITSRRKAITQSESTQNISSYSNGAYLKSYSVGLRTDGSQKSKSLNVKVKEEGIKLVQGNGAIVSTTRMSDPTLTQKRSFVSGNRFEDFDPAADFEEDSASIPIPEPVTNGTSTEQINSEINTKPNSKLNNVLGNIKQMYFGARNPLLNETLFSRSLPKVPHNSSEQPAIQSSVNRESSELALLSPVNDPAIASPGPRPLQRRLAPTDETKASYKLPLCNCSRQFSPSQAAALSGARSSCGGFADLRGPGQYVISYSFYGNASSVYFSGIEANLQKLPEIYPGWVMRVYHDVDRSIPEQNAIVCDIECRYSSVDFCDVRDLPDLGDLSRKFGMIWRFMVLADESVERFIVRDLDSLIGTRERAAVDDWIASNRTFHAMRDHPAHGTEMLGGLWGGWNRYNQLYSRVRARIVKSTQWRFKGLDQRVLTVVLWPVIVRHRDMVAHDSYLCWYYPMSRPFPTRRRDVYDMVGAPSLLEPRFHLKSHCSYFCRPRQHKDWVWC